MSAPNIRGILTSFSPSSDFFAISSGDGRIKIWDTLKGQLQTEFADIAATDALGVRSESERGHLSLDYKCMKWVQLESKKKKKKAGSSLLVLGTGSGDVLALDVSLGQLKWKVRDCHPGGVNAVSYSGRNSSIYTAGEDGMVCQIDFSFGRILGKFKASTKAISALSISADGKLLATASAQLKIYNCTNNKKIQKFSGHSMSVRCMIFSEDGNFILSSAVGERFIAIWKIDGGKNQPASCVLSMEHPAVVLDSKGSDTEASNGSGLYVLAISEAGLCYFWYGSSIEALKASKPTKISLSIDYPFSRSNKGLAIFAAKFHHIISPASSKTLVAYGALVKPSFEKLTLEYGKDMNLNASQDGVLLQIGQPNMSHKSQVAQTKVTALDRANAEDAILPHPKLYTHEKKRKHGTTPLIAEAQKVNDLVVNSTNKTCPARAEVYLQKMEEDSFTSIEDSLRGAGILGAKDNPIVKRDPRNPPDSAIDVTVHGGARFSINLNMPTKKIRSHILSMSPSDAYNLLESLLSSWRTRSATSKHVLPWIYHILVIHGHFIISNEPAKQLLDGLHKMTRLKCGAIQSLLNLSGCLQLVMAQIDKAGQNMCQELPAGHHTDKSDEEEEEEEEEEEDIDELVYGEEDNASQSGSDDDNELQA